MLHNEHLRTADELYEIRNDDGGNALHIYIKDGNAIIYQCLDDLIQHIYFGKQTDRVYCSETDLEAIYKSDMYILGEIANQFNLTGTF
jgi:hypothetical protein